MKISRFLFLRRNRLLSLIFLVGLTLTMLIGNVGAGVYQSTIEAAESIRQSYLCVGVENTLYEKSDEELPFRYVDGVKTWTFDPKERDYPSYERIAALPYVREVVQRKACIARAEGITTLGTATLDPWDYAEELEELNSICCLRIRCLEIQSEKRTNETIAYEDGRVEEFYRLGFTVQAEVIYPLILHPSYELEDCIEMWGFYTTEANEIPFEVGKEYYVWGRFQGITIIENYGVKQKVPDRKQRLDVGYWFALTPLSASPPYIEKNILKLKGKRGACYCLQRNIPCMWIAPPKTRRRS